MTVKSVSFCSGGTLFYLTPWTGVWFHFLYALPLGICINWSELSEPSLLQADQSGQSQPVFSVWGASAVPSPLWPCAGLPWVGPCEWGWHWTQHFRCGPSGAKQRGRITFLHQLSRLLLQPRILLAAFASNNEKSILTASGFRLPLNPNKSEIKPLKKWSQLCIYPANVIGTISFLAGVSFQAWIFNTSINTILLVDGDQNRCCFYLWRATKLINELHILC